MVDNERTVRTVSTDEELAAYLRGMMTAFLEKREVSEEWVAHCCERYDLDRTWMALDGDTQVGTTRTFPTGLRVPGLAEVPVSCLTQVTVLPTHTRRGHLSRLMRAQLEAAVAAGEVASLLIAAEWPIYGRFGYGPATEWASWEVDAREAVVQGQPVGTCELVDPAAFDEAAAVVLGAQQAAQSGCIERVAWHRRRIDGVDPSPADDPKPARVWVVHRDPAGNPDGILMYDPKEKWDGMRPRNIIDVADMAYTGPIAERELWRYLIDVDLVTTVKWHGAPNSSIRHILADGRSARQTGRWDQLWARILDVPACLSSRSYAGDGRVVLEVLDPFLGRGGRFALTAAGGSGTCEATDDEPEVTLTVSALSAAWLGGTDLRTMAPGGAVEEHVEGALDRLAGLLRWHQDPWCHTDF